MSEEDRTNKFPGAYYYVRTLKPATETLVAEEASSESQKKDTKRPSWFSLWRMNRSFNFEWFSRGNDLGLHLNAVVDVSENAPKYRGEIDAAKLRLEEEQSPPNSVAARWLKQWYDETFRAVPNFFEDVARYEIARDLNTGEVSQSSATTRSPKSLILTNIEIPDEHRERFISHLNEQGISIGPEKIFRGQVAIGVVRLSGALVFDGNISGSEILQGMPSKEQHIKAQELAAEEQEGVVVSKPARVAPKARPVKRDPLSPPESGELAR